MNHWITLTADMLLEVIDQAELDAITAADTDGSVVDGIIQDVTASVREAIAANPANVMDLTRDTIPRTLRPEALDMIAWRLLKRFAVAVSESRDKAATSARERLEAVRESDAILREEFQKAGLEGKVWQYFTIVPDFKSVGVRDNARSFEYPVILRAVNTVDAMTATIEHLDWALLDRITQRIVSEVNGVNRVCYDLSPKPTGTIEWE